MSTINDQMYLTQENQWNAVVGRDGAADKCFVYAVKTTGIYCRSSCSSRQPNRVNVAFFTTCEAAERAGFRACKRCRPKEFPSSLPESVVEACRLIEEADEPPSLNELADAVGLSPFYFHRLFKEAVGVTPKAYADARRVARFQRELVGKGTVTEAVYNAGFRSSSRCYEKTDAMLGMRPKEFKHGAKGLRIRWAVAECCLGWVIVAATQKGICMIEFADSTQVLLTRLSDRFANAELLDGDKVLTNWVTRIVNQIETPGRHLDLPLDVQGTAFQQKVWKALQEIPIGETVSYSEVAHRIGSPTAVRAVAQAIGANPVAVAIPCHRVIGANSELTGYRWGIERKKKLLDKEAES
jgi:AraC family transcriptional regulator of adaptative response/methylated-DNA-[protein]-cysteine methyltransferase